jgi:hypothetical protein
MPYNQVMHKFKTGALHSGSKSGKLVKNRKQAIAIMLSEKKKAEGGDSEYKADNENFGGNMKSKSISPSIKSFNKMMGNISGKKKKLKLK